MTSRVSWVKTGSETDPCCCGEGDCCLYPWPDPLGTPLYPDTDLPDTVVWHDAAIDPPEDITLTRSGYEYSGTGSTGDYSITALSGDAFWSAQGPPIDGEDRVSILSGCLIGDTFESELMQVSDEFLATYNVHIEPVIGGPWEDLSPVDTTISRVSNCCWEWDDPAAVADYGPLSAWSFCYGGNTDIASLYKWSLGPSTDKNNPQNSPEGDYTSADFTVTVAP